MAVEGPGVLRTPAPAVPWVWPTLHEGQRSIVLDLLVHGPRSRADVVRRSGLSRASLSRLTRDLVGLELAPLANSYSLTQTAAALRFGEVTRRPVMVVTPRRLLSRGSAWVWGRTEQDIRHLAAEAPLPPGVRRLRLTDEGRRVALVGE